MAVWRSNLSCRCGVINKLLLPKGEWDAWGFAASCWNPTGTSFWHARPFLPTQLSSLRAQLGKRYLAQGHPPIENPPYWNDTYYKKCSVQKVTLPNRDGSKFTIPNLICWTWNEIKKGREQKSRFKTGTDLQNSFWSFSVGTETRMRTACISIFCIVLLCC